MWELKELRVDEEFDKITPEEHREIRAGETGLPVVRMYRTEFARWEEDADEPEKLGTLAVVWELVEKDCECGSEKDGCCVCDTLAVALGDALKGWNVYPDSLWEASTSPGWESQPLGTVWVYAYEQYQYEQNQRFEYSLHPDGVSAGLRSELFAAVGVEEVSE